jgi:hypothetical protein
MTRVGSSPKRINAALLKNRAWNRSSPHQSGASNFVVNLKIAKAIGLVVAVSFLLRADEMIE